MKEEHAKSVLDQLARLAGFDCLEVTEKGNIHLLDKNAQISRSLHFRVHCTVHLPVERGSQAEEVLYTTCLEHLLALSAEGDDIVVFKTSLSSADNGIMFKKVVFLPRHSTLESVQILLDLGGERDV